MCVCATMKFETIVSLLLLFGEFVENVLVTNVPIYLSGLSPILYHEACFAERVCLKLSDDGILYVSCGDDDCESDKESTLFVKNNCRTPSRSVTVDRSTDCTLLGGFCAAVSDDDRYVCVPAVPFNGSWWPEAVPTSTQNCRQKCGVDRAFFKSWNKTGGYERRCVCSVPDETIEPVKRRRRTIYDNRVVQRLLYRDPFPFCYFEQCNSVVDYGSRFFHERNFTGIELRDERSNVLLLGFVARKNYNVNGTDCSKVPVPRFAIGIADSCLNQKSQHLFLHPLHLPDFYYERKLTL